MKNTLENRKFIEAYFKDSQFRAAGRDNEPSKTAHPFMLFGLGWGDMFLKCICINFDSENVNPHISIEYSPCSARSSYYYMDLTKENILKLPRTDTEYFDNYHQKMGNEKKLYFKAEKVNEL